MHPSGGTSKPEFKPAVQDTPSQQLLDPLNQATKPGSGVRDAQPCPVKKHFVKVKLVYKDDRKPVLTTACKILKGDAEVDGGPLTNGELGTAKVLDPASYEVTFPDIDSAEWDVG